MSKQHGKAAAQKRFNPVAAPDGITKGERRLRRRATEEDDLARDELSAKQSARILKVAREQLMEEDEEADRQGVPVSSHYEEEDDLQDDDDGSVFGGDEYYGGELEVDEADERCMELFMREHEGERRTLADIVMAKLEAHERRMRGEVVDEESEEEVEALPEKVLQVYSQVGVVMSRYKAGKIPKVFKMIPSYRNWQDILYLTQPDRWTPHAHFAATRIFAANLRPKQAQQYYNTFLLPAVRDDIAEHKRLNYHLYRAVKKALFRPAAFFKGFLLPLVEGGGCTLHEAVIIGSVLAKVSIPVKESAATVLRLAEMPYSGPTSLFLKVLLNKKYALPFRCLEAVVVHFTSFASETRTLPVLWHQALLVFVQRYKRGLDSEQRAGLRKLCHLQRHHLITDEIYRELNSVAGADDMSVV